MSRHKLKLKILLTFTLVFSFIASVREVVLANGGDGRIEVIPPEESGIGGFKLPTFLDLSGVQSFNIFQYLGLFLTLIFIVLALTWVIVAIRAGVKVIRSEGNDEAIVESKNRFGGVFASIAILFLFFAGIALIGNFLGVGSFWDWPRVFSTCTSGNYYFQLAIALPDVDTETACFHPERLSSSSCTAHGLQCADSCEAGPLFSVFGGSPCVTACSDDFVSCLEQLQ